MIPSKFLSKFDSSDRPTEPRFKICNDLTGRLGCPLLTARLPCGTEEFRYRCFLPDLTGFAAPSCTGPNYQQSTSVVEKYQIERSSIYSRLLLPTRALTHLAERGGFEPPVLFWSTHDFQSCTFNRSVTSPAPDIWDFSTALSKLAQREVIFHKSKRKNPRENVRSSGIKIGSCNLSLRSSTAAVGIFVDS